MSVSVITSMARNDESEKKSIFLFSVPQERQEGGGERFEREKTEFKRNKNN